MRLLRQEEIEAVRKGDLKPLADIHEMIYKDCTEFIIRKYNASQSDAHDIVMDSYTILVTKIQQGTYENVNLKSFLFKVGQNLWLNKRKRNSRIESIDPFKINTIMKASYPEHEAESLQDRLKAVRFAINSMSPKCKKILTMTLINGLSLDTATDELEYKNKESCKSAKSRCLKHLIEILKK